MWNLHRSRDPDRLEGGRPEGPHERVKPVRRLVLSASTCSLVREKPVSSRLRHPAILPGFRPGPDACYDPRPIVPGVPQVDNGADGQSFAGLSRLDYLRK